MLQLDSIRFNDDLLILFDPYMFSLLCFDSDSSVINFDYSKTKIPKLTSVSTLFYPTTA